MTDTAVLATRDRPVVRCHGCRDPGWWMGFVWADRYYRGSLVEHPSGRECLSSPLVEFLYPGDDHEQ